VLLVVLLVFIDTSYNENREKYDNGKAQVDDDRLPDFYPGSQRLGGFHHTDDRRAGDMRSSSGLYNVVMPQSFVRESMGIDYERRPSIGTSSGFGGGQGDKYEAMKSRKKVKKSREEKQLHKVCATTLIKVCSSV